MSTKNTSLSRRSMLRGAAIGGGALGLLSFSQIFGLKSVSAAHDTMDDVQTIANLAATAETLAATSYYGTIAYAGDLGYSDADVAYFMLAMDAELYHLEVLQSLGGASLAQEFYVPAAFLSDKGTNVQTFIAAETAFTGAYLAATRRFAELGQPRLAATTAQHAATEAEHLALTRMTGGLIPNPNALPAAIYYNVSDAVPTLLPFLQGGEGFVGPVAFPGVDAIKAMLAGVEAQRLPTFLGVF
jgi:hypothetical protein